MSALYVVFKVDGTEYVVAASDVLHLESYTGATRVPGAPPHVCGVMQIRRRVVPVVDVRVRLGLPAVAPGLDSRVVVVQAGPRAVGLLVDSAREVVRLDESALKDPPDVIDRQAAGFVLKLVETDATRAPAASSALSAAGPGREHKRLLLLIDFHRLIDEETTHGLEQRPD